ncbi:MAG: dUTP diphosphatase [Lactobacillaceae bacterium]|jgi:dUTP pyrophosphatase|nr:dUTP diphosphatase [Lactobacillaceae bacterium]
MRGFEIVTKYKNENIELPKRETANAAGYDFKAAKNMLFLPNEIKLIPTAIKSYMQPNEVLMLFNRSSAPKKLGLVLPNSVGIVDADYYNNENNEGEIFFQMLNITDHEVNVLKGDRIGQGMFTNFLIIDNEQAGGVRNGGFGSTGEK